MGPTKVDGGNWKGSGIGLTESKGDGGSKGGSKGG
jgi:hypothetical protein